MGLNGEISDSDPGYRVLAALVRHPSGLTRHALAGAAGLAPATLASILRGEGSQDLSGVVVEAKSAHAAPGGGPRPKIVRLREGICVAGVEIGHGHVRIGIVGLDGELWPDAEGRYYQQTVMPVFRERRRTLNWIAGGLEGERGALPDFLARAFAERMRTNGGGPGFALGRPLVLGVGVSVAGPVDPSDGRLVCARPADGLFTEEEGTIACADWDGESAGQGLRDRLRDWDRTELLGWRASRFRSASAAELCARAELRDGTLTDTDFAIFVKWTGNISAAVVLGGEVFVGSRGLAGGFAMHPLTGPGDDPRPESQAEERIPLGIALGIRRLTSEIARDLELRPRRSDELLRDYFRDEILSIAHGEGRRSSRETAIVKSRLADAAMTLGKTLAHTVDMLDPAKLVVGGGVFESRDWSIVAEPLSEGIRANIAAPSKAPVVEVARYCEHPALDGAIASRLEAAEAAPALLRACETMVPVLSH